MPERATGRSTPLWVSVSWSYACSYVLCHLFRVWIHRWIPWLRSVLHGTGLPCPGASPNHRGSRGATDPTHHRPASAGGGPVRTGDPPGRGPLSPPTPPAAYPPTHGRGRGRPPAHCPARC